MLLEVETDKPDEEISLSFGDISTFGARLSSNLQKVKDDTMILISLWIRLDPQ